MSLDSNTSHEGVTQGVVYKKSQGYHSVRDNGCLVNCEISSRLRKHLEYPEDSTLTCASRKRFPEDY